jgi:hypothetical protein
MHPNWPRRSLFTWVLWGSLAVATVVVGLAIASEVLDRPGSLTLGDRLGIMGVAVGAAALAIAGVGFYLTLKQVALTVAESARAATASQAAAAAVENALSVVERNQLLLAIQDIRRLEDQLDGALTSPEPQPADVLRVVGEWRRLATDVYASLEASADVPPELISQLRESLTLAADAKGAIVGGGTDLGRATEPLRDLVPRISDGLGLLTAKLKTEIGGRA